MALNLPPQAYTRETLMQAFDWIRTQPKTIQELAQNSDTLVSIYMQARRRGGSLPLQNPVSAQNFKQDLKNLAEGLKQFEFEGGSSAIADAGVAVPQTPQQIPQPPPTMASPAHFAAAATQPTASPSLYDLNLDAKSLDAARKVQQKLNLSSENEALRLLIALGFEKVRELIK